MNRQVDTRKLLVLTGGGFRGLYTSKVIENLESRFNRDLHRHCDFFAGTSIGGIISLGLAAGLSGKDLVQGFIRHKKNIFRKKKFHSFYFSARYGSAGLKNAIEDIFRHKAALALSDIRPVMVTAVELDTGETHLISNLDAACKEWKVIDAAMVTSAAQTYFPAHTVRSKRYVDGGSSCNMPDIAASQMYCELNQVRFDDLRILSIGTCHHRRDYPRYAGISGDAGGITWARNAEFFVDVQAPLIEKQCKAIFQPNRYTRIDAELDTHIDMDDISDTATRELLEKADWSTEISRLPTAVASFMT